MKAEVVARDGGGVAMVGQANKTEGVRPRLQCWPVRASGSWKGHVEANILLGHDSLSPLCAICLQSWLLSVRTDMSS